MAKRLRRVSRGGVGVGSIAKTCVGVAVETWLSEVILQALNERGESSDEIATYEGGANSALDYNIVEIGGQTYYLVDEDGDGDVDVIYGDRNSDGIIASDECIDISDDDDIHIEIDEYYG